jgi:hypothetical protein
MYLTMLKGTPEELTAVSREGSERTLSSALLNTPPNSPPEELEPDA